MHLFHPNRTKYKSPDKRNDKISRSATYGLKALLSLLNALIYTLTGIYASLPYTHLI